jgi:hypothetical protein
MKPINIKQKPALIIGTLLTLPSMYLILISLMKYEFHIPFLFDAASPFLESAGIRETVGWNINLLIVFGPVLAFLLNMLSVLELYYASGKDRISLHFSIKKSWWNLAVILTSTIALLVLFAYIMAENCHCG